MWIEAPRELDGWMKMLPPKSAADQTISKFTEGQPSRLAFQKYAEKRKGAVKMRMTVLKMRIYTCKQKCDRNVCELWIVECALFRLQS